VLLGTVFLMLFIDGIRRKTVLKDMLPLLGLIGIASGVLEMQDIHFEAILYIQYFLVGLSLATITWLTAVEVFPYPQRLPSVALSFVVFYLVSFVLIKTSVSLEVVEFIFGGSCLLLGGVMFAFIASTPSRAIRLKFEKKKYVSVMKSLRGSRRTRASTRTRARSVASSAASNARRRPLRVDSNPLQVHDVEHDMEGETGYLELVDNTEVAGSQTKNKSA